jgi:hypothetical protein
MCTYLSLVLILLFESAIAQIPSIDNSGSACLSRSSVTAVTGNFSTGYRGQPANGTAVDARGGTWSFENGWIATPKTSSDVCWVGGSFFLTIDDTKNTPTDAWANIWHHNGGWTLKNSNNNWTFDGIAVSHVGDAFNFASGSQNFTIKNSYISDIRDDCVQNDYMHAGSVINNFFNGCYVGFSARASSGNIPPDGHLNTWLIEDNLIWIKPMYSVYKGDSPGSGQLFKWEFAYPDYAPKLVFRNNIVRIGKRPFQAGSSGGSFYFPADIDFSANVLVWDGSDSVPSELAVMFSAAYSSRIGTMEDWNSAADQWLNSHTSVTIAREQIPNNKASISAYPNPFITSVFIELKGTGDIREAGIYDLNGRLVKQLNGFEIKANPDKITLAWEGTDEKGKALSSGIYVLKIAAHIASLKKQLLLLR